MSRVPCAAPDASPRFWRSDLAGFPPIALDQELEQDRTDFTIDFPIDLARTPATLKSLDRLMPVGDVVAEAFQREIKGAIIVEGIAQLDLRGGEAKAVFGEPLPRKEFAGVDLALRGNVGMAEHIGAGNVVAAS